MNEELTLQNLKKCFETAIEEGFLTVGVAVQIGGYEVPEVIINSHENFEKKLEYYLGAYNENLTLKANSDIRIVGFMKGDYVENIFCELTM